jgi:hypothetical protein
MPRLRDARSLFRRRGRDGSPSRPQKPKSDASGEASLPDPPWYRANRSITPGLLSRSETGRLQNRGQNVPINAPIIRIETRISSHEITRSGAERWICGFARRPKTRRRLSGWLSKIRMRRILLPAAFVWGRGISCLITKIFFARMPGCPLAERRSNKLG